MKHLLPLFIVLSPTMLSAQSLDENFLNQSSNVRYEGDSPTRIADNSTTEWAMAQLFHTWQRGHFHAIDASGHANNMGVSISGLREFNKFHLQGHLSYLNQTSTDQRWNSTLWNLPYNPFVLCDSILSDYTTESFDLGFIVSYDFSKRFRMGLETNVRTGSLSNQTDPRPHTTTSVIPFTLGADYFITKQWMIGLSCGARLFNSYINYTNVQPTLGYTYFLMKGMGDYQRRSTADESGYSRDYHGWTYHGTLSATWKPSARWSFFAEGGYKHSYQDATDGNTSYEYRGGDYSETLLVGSLRLLFHPHSHVRHNLRLSMEQSSGEAIWYEQERMTDLEHANLQYYRILGDAFSQKNKRSNYVLHYQFDKIRQERRTFFLDFQTAYTSILDRHIVNGLRPEQKFGIIHVNLQAGKLFTIRDVTLLTQLQGGYTHPLNKKFATGSPYIDSKDITAAYVRPIFEYASSKQGVIGTLIDANMPVGPRLNVGIYATADYHFYLDKEEYWQGYKNTSMTVTQIGAYLKF